MEKGDLPTQEEIASIIEEAGWEYYMNNISQVSPYDYIAGVILRKFRENVRETKGN